MSKQILAIEIWRKCLIVKENNNDTMQKKWGGGGFQTSPHKMNESQLRAKGFQTLKMMYHKSNLYDSSARFQPLGSLKSLACLWDKISDFWMRHSFESKLFNDLLDPVHNSGLNNDLCFEFHPTQTSEILHFFWAKKRKPYVSGIMWGWACFLYTKCSIY